MRPLSLLLAPLLLAACSHASSAGKVIPHAPVLFERVAEAEAAKVANPHQYAAGALCQRCHVAGERSPRVDPIELCAQCHEPKFMKHPYRVPQPTEAGGLPLLAGRLIACHTCHDPHDTKKHPHGLRDDYVPLCRKCHKAHR